MVIVGGTPNNPNNTIESIESSIDPYTSGNGFENRWGYKVDSAEDTYDPIPKSSARAQIGDYTTASSGNNTTLTIAAKAGATKAQGTYIGNLTVTAIANINKVYSLTYNKNTEDVVTNLPNNIPQTSTTNDTPSIQIPSNIPTREGYDFVSWCTTQVLDGETCSGTAYDPGEQMTIDLDPTTANAIILYAVWESNLADFNKAFANAGKSKVSGTDYYAMQDMSSSICSSVTGPTTATEDISTQLIDTRDNKIYWVSKLADGNCWMTQNLDLDLNKTTLPLTPENSDVSMSWDPGEAFHTKTAISYSANPADMYSWNFGDYKYDGVANNSCGMSIKSIEQCLDGYGISIANATDSEIAFSGTLEQRLEFHRHVGNHYQYATATAGSGNNVITSENNALDSICPKGWELPKNTGNKSLANLQNIANIGLVVQNWLDPPYYIVRTGNVYYGDLQNTGANAHIWTATPYDANRAYFPRFSSISETDLHYVSTRAHGFSIRCVAR